MTGGDPYLWPDSTVLKNRLGIRDAATLDLVERRINMQRAEMGIPTGNFDLDHLCAIHHHLFQDVYEWAGQIRTVEIAKDGHQFQFKDYIKTGMADVHRRLEQSDFLRHLRPGDFAEGAAQIIGDINYVHPFREGNGRTQLFYLQQLADQARHPIDLQRLEPARWLDASRSAHVGDYGPMAEEIDKALLERSRGLER